MPQQKSATLTAIFSEILANLAFMFTDEDETLPDEGMEWWETSIRYKGPVSGALTFKCPRPFTNELAANLLGVDPDQEVEEEQAQDAVKEFMNIICGQVVTTFHGTEHVFDLTIPEVSVMASPPQEVFEENPRICSLSVAGHRIQLTWTLGEA